MRLHLKKKVSIKDQTTGRSNSRVESSRVEFVQPSFPIRMYVYTRYVLIVPGTLPVLTLPRSPDTPITEFIHYRTVCTYSTVPISIYGIYVTVLLYGRYSTLTG